MYKTWILVILLSMALFSSSGYVEAEENGKLWKGAATEKDLVVVVNFLMNNKGKEIKLGGEKHKVTGKEKLDVVIAFMPCCDEGDAFKKASAFGKVSKVEFPDFYASIPADKIPEIDKIGEVMGIKLEPKAHDFWMKVIKQ